MREEGKDWRKVWELIMLEIVVNVTTRVIRYILFRGKKQGKVHDWQIIPRMLWRIKEI